MVDRVGGVERMDGCGWDGWDEWIDAVDGEQWSAGDGDGGDGDGDRDNC